MKNRFYNSNNRAVINEFGVVQQVTNYYPFGSVFSTNKAAYTKSPDAQPYKYNGKELGRTHGLDWYDFDARQHDPFVSGFTSLDPLCEKYTYQSPYVYAGNNPVRNIDFDGLGPKDRVKYARQFIELAPEYKQEAKAEWKNRFENTPAGLQFMDCSELVSRVMTKDGFNQFSKSPNSSAIYGMRKSKDFEFDQTPQVGDIAVWLDDPTRDAKGYIVQKGHVEIVTAVNDDGTVSVAAAHRKGVKPSETTGNIKKLNPISLEGIYAPRRTLLMLKMLLMIQRLNCL